MSNPIAMYLHVPSHYAERNSCTVYELPTKDKQLSTHFSPPELNFVKHNMPIGASNEPVLVTEIGSLKTTVDDMQKSGTSASCFVGLMQLNDVRYINKFLESISTNLKDNGVFIGYVETTKQRWQRIQSKILPVLRKPYYAIEYLVKRVWPKMPHVKRLYFAITKGKNRSISKVETIGRLYSCGFTLIREQEINGRLYFAAKKTSKPDYNLEATYGPLIHLNRTGKNNRPIKVLKFRTMYPYSEYLQAYIYERNGLQEGGKLKNDIRVNRLGKIMRKYFLDELPMLINLLKGDLKLFGVRPLSKHYLSLYPEEFVRYRSKFKPGLFPPFYADMPKTLEEIIASEKKYLERYEKNALVTDLTYFFKAAKKILIDRARSH